MMFPRDHLFLWIATQNAVFLTNVFSSFHVHLYFVRGKGKEPPWEVGYQDAAMQLVVC